MSAPWMPLYVADYLADTGHLTTLEHGAYLLLIMTYWRKGGLPDDDAQLARIVRMSPEEWSNVRSTIVQLFSNGWRHKRIDAELERCTEKAKKASFAGKRSAEARLSQRTLSERSTDVPTEGQPSQSQSQSEKKNIVDADASPLAFERDRTKGAEREALRSLGEQWNAFAGSVGLPQIDEIRPGSPRERAALARIREGADFERVFAKIRASPLLLGKKGNWRADFNWVMNPTNMQKILEGNYDEVREARRFG